jgi:Cu(I)/Ag(I) efflux system membrane fusion protein
VPVRIGREWGDKLEVLAGLQAGQQVVASGQFLIDSEASMQGLLQRQAGPSAAPASAAASAASQGASSATVHQGEGRIVGLTPQEVTLDHGPVPSLKWPAMQMGFKLAQPGLVDSFKVGDKVQFTFRESAEGYEVTRVQRDPKGGAR